LRWEQVGQEVTLCGWVDTSRDHGGTLFIDLRDRYGKTQVVFAPEAGQAILDESRKLRTEDVVLVPGKVAPRPRAWDRGGPGAQRTRSYRRTDHRS
jgi:aspartyl-tRNA synthetase